MNGRIRELMEEAIRFRLDVDSKEYEAQVSPEDLEVFAELIVRECMSVCKSRVGNSDYNTGRMWCASDIKEHFGVE
jgi:hypothetical protein